MSDLLQRIDAAIEDYQRSFPPPYSLAPNLQLAAEAAAEIAELRRELDRYLAAVGLPEGSSLSELIAHHRVSAGFAVALEMLDLQPGTTGDQPSAAS